jgi:hypothetical protein
MSVLFTPVGASVYLLLALLVAMAGRDRRMGFWGFFWSSLLLTPLVTGFFIIMAQSVIAPSPGRMPRKRARAGVPAPGAPRVAAPGSAR